MYKIGVVGDRGSVLGFMALGFSVSEAADAETARTALRSMVKSEEYGVIFVTETLAVQLEEDIALYKDKTIPAIVSIPGSDGASGYGMAAIRSAVERAVGADILFRE